MTSITRPYTLAALLVFALLGCTVEYDFTPDGRGRSFDRVWHALQYHVHPHVNDRTIDTDSEALRDKYRNRCVQSEDPRSFLLTLADLLQRLSDAHTAFDDLNEYWQSLGIEATYAGSSFGTRDGVWVRIGNKALLSDAPCSRLGDQWYLLRTIDGVRATFPLGVQLTAGKPGDVTEWEVQCSDGSIDHCKLRFPEPTENTKIRQRQRYAVESSTVARDAYRFAHVRVYDTGEQDTLEEFDKAISDASDADGLILDLRRNVGGTVAIASRMLGRFVQRPRTYGFVLRQRGLSCRKRDWMQDPLRVSPSGIYFEKPIVVLISSRTGSGGEVLAFALADLRQAPLVGETTVGAGAVTSELPLVNGLGLRIGAMPIHRYDGRSVQRVGVRPDVPIPRDWNELSRDGFQAIASWDRRVLEAGVGTLVEIVRRADTLTAGVTK